MHRFALPAFAGFAARFLRAFSRRQDGVAAVEFALILPVMLTLLLGTVEFSNAMQADRKVGQMASIAADLVAQDTEISNAEMNDIMAGMQAIMFPLPTAAMRVRITSIVADTSGTPRVAWSDARNTAARAANSIVTLPRANMLTPGEGLIYAEVWYTYTSSPGQFLTGGITMDDQFYLRPRRSLTVARVP